MRKKLLRNWGLKLTSLLLAFLLWFLVAQINDPNDERTFSAIKVKLINTELLEKENKVYEVLDNTDLVRVTINAPQSLLEQVDQSDIVAEADMSKLTDINTIVINYYVQGLEEIDDITGSHDVVRLSVEDKSRKWVKVISETVGEVAEGYVIGNITSDQTLIEVSGPKSAVDQVSYVKGQIGVTGATNNLSANVDVELCDINGNILQLDEVDMNVDYVRMSVEVLSTKEVPLRVSYIGVPADGYKATGTVEYTPETVWIAGTSSALANVSQLVVPEDKVNITGISETKTISINLKDVLPSNIRLADSEFDGKVSVTVHIEPAVEKKLRVPDDNLTIVNIPEEFTAELADGVTSCEITVSGLEAVVESIASNNIKGVIDIKIWMKDENITTLYPGTYNMPVSFNLSEEVNIKTPVMVQVTVADKETE